MVFSLGCVSDLFVFVYVVRATRAREGHQAPTESLELVDRPDQLVKKEKRARKGNK